MTTEKITYRKTAELIPYHNNPRENAKAVEAVAASIRNFGFKVPIVIDANDVIVAGHTRLLAAKEIGIESVPCIVADDLTDEQVRAFRLADNKTAELAGWNFDLLAEELGSIEMIDMSAFGFDVNRDDETEAGELAEDEPPEPEEPPKTKPGEMFRLGDHVLLCGDATHPADIEKLTCGTDIDLLLTDPPYNVDVAGTDRPNSKNSGVGIMNDKMGDAAFVEFLTKAFRAAADVMKPGAPFYIWYAGLNHSKFDAAVNNISEWKLHEQLVWVKSHFVLGRNSDYQWAHEPCLYGWKTGAAHYFTDNRAESTVIEEPGAKLTTLKKGELIALCEKLMGEDTSTTVIRADKPPTAELHPTVKPQNVLAPLIRNSSKQGATILDPFGGSGSTLIACEQLKRRCYMLELDPHYCDVIIRRWEQFTGREATKIEKSGMETKN